MIFLVCAESGLANTQVLFFAAQNSQGLPAVLEPGGRFFHIAITTSEKRAYLHVHPKRGVEWIKNLSELGRVETVLELPEEIVLSASQIESMIGLPYDHTYNWNDLESSYCSKLVGLLLGISPVPMSFATTHWQGQPRLPRGALGLSPDDIYAVLKKWPLAIESHPSSCVGSWRGLEAKVLDHWHTRGYR